MGINATSSKKKVRDMIGSSTQKSKNTEEKGIMEVGDLVILYSGHSSVSHIWLTPAAIVDNKFGRFHHNDFLGKPFGSRIASRGNSDGWLLACNQHQLWASAQSTRTQIVILQMLALLLLISICILEAWWLNSKDLVV